MASNQGTATVNWGAFPGTTDVEIAVADATITAGALAEAWIWPVATADHSVDEHIMAVEMFDVVAHTPVAGVGFSIKCVARDFGGEKLEAPGIGRKQNANATAGSNYLQQPTVTGSVGGKTLNTIWGSFTLAWCWSD